MSLTDFIVYHGSLSQAHYNQLPVIQASPQSSGHMRFVSKELFAAPVTVQFMAVPLQAVKTLGNDSGIHFRFEIDNEWGYTIQLVRKDGRTKMAREAGWLQYDDEKYGDGVEFVVDRPYLCTVSLVPAVGELQARWSVENTEGRYEASGAFDHVSGNAPVREGGFRPVWQFGRIGFRFDGLRVLVTPPVVS